MDRKIKNMPSPESKKQLNDLVTRSPTLDPKKKDAVIRQMDSFSDDQVQKLTNIFTTEKQQLQKIEDTYRPREVTVKKQYLETLQTFEQSSLQKAINAVETKTENKEQELENILKGLPFPPKKKSHKILMLLAFLALAGAVFYLLVYQFKVISL